jgi:hypothetical protein
VNLFLDSAQTYDSAQIAAKYSSPGNLTITSHNPDGVAPQGLTFSAAGEGYVNLGENANELIIGARFIIPGGSVPTTLLMGFWDAGTFQCGVALRADGSVAVTNTTNSDYATGFTVIASSASGLVSAGSAFYLELKVTFETGATGSVSVQLNSASVATATNVVTAKSANSYANAAGFASAAANLWYGGDVYINDATGSYNNGFDGDIHVGYLLPTGAGRVTQWTPSSGTNHGNAAENPPTGDSNYNGANAVNLEDAYVMAAISNTVNSVLAVQVSGYTRKDASGGRSIALGVGNGTTESFGGNIALGSGYTYARKNFDTNPLTSAPWVPTDLSAIQGAIKVTV